jgi:short-subunit dehydrogenase
MIVMYFNDKVVVISGATGGMGKALAEQLAHEHCNVALFARNEDKLKQLSEALGKTAASCFYKKCDVKNKDDIHDAVSATVKQYGRIDIAILAAGILVPNPIEQCDSSIIKETLDINFMGDVYFIEALLPVMKKQKAGAIVGLSTLPDRRGVPGWGAYGASKAALSWFLESLRAEAKQKYNINIITVKPGSVETPMIEDYHRTGAVPPEKAAAIIIKGIKKHKKIIQFPFLQVVMTRITDMFPNIVYDNLPIDMQKVVY